MTLSIPWDGLGRALGFEQVSTRRVT